MKSRKCCFVIGPVEYALVRPVQPRPALTTNTAAHFVGEWALRWTLRQLTIQSDAPDAALTQP